MVKSGLKDHSVVILQYVACWGIQCTQDPSPQVPALPAASLAQEPRFVLLALALTLQRGLFPALPPVPSEKSL